jgi:hypothetical protein
MASRTAHAASKPSAIAHHIEKAEIDRLVSVLGDALDGCA